MRLSSIFCLFSLAITAQCALYDFDFDSEMEFDIQGGGGSAGFGFASASLQPGLYNLNVAPTYALPIQSAVYQAPLASKSMFSVAPQTLPLQSATLPTQFESDTQPAMPVQMNVVNEVRPALTTSPIVTTRYGTQTIIQPKLITQPIVRNHLVQQPIVTKHHVQQPVYRALVTQPIIQPHIITQTTIQPQITDQTTIQPVLSDTTAVTQQLIDRSVENAPITAAATMSSTKSMQAPIMSTAPVITQAPIVQQPLQGKKAAKLGLGLGLAGTDGWGF